HRRNRSRRCAPVPLSWSFLVCASTTRTPCCTGREDLSERAGCVFVPAYRQCTGRWRFLLGPHPALPHRGRDSPLIRAGEGCSVNGGAAADQAAARRLLVRVVVA